MSLTSRSVFFARVFFAFSTLLTLGGLALNAALPSGWSNADIGTVSTSGTADYSEVDGVFTVQGSGSGDIAGAADNFHFAHRSLNGDGYIVVRIASLTNTNAWSKAGIMIRETLAANSKHVLMMVTPTSGTGIKWRSATAGSTTQVMVNGAAPRWLKLERRGKMVTGFESADGVTWNVVQRVALSMTADVYVGLVACSKTSTLATMTADQVLIDSPDASLTLPWPWAEQSVGAPTDAGVALYDGSYVLSNLGADIAGTADKMKYVSQTLIGDGVLTVKVASVTSGDNSTRLGVMMRESLDANARNVVLGLTTSKSIAFMSRRTVAGTLTSRATAVTVAVPAWLRLQRSGNVFTAWRSTDGVNWTEHGSETLELGPILNVGLAYSNRSTSTWAIGVGDELKLTSPADADGNGLDDAWEVQYFGGTGVNSQADPDGDGLTNSQEWEIGNDPQVFNLEGQHPLLELISGGDQVGVTGSLLTQPLLVRVKDSLSGNPLANIPVFFHVGQGNGLLGSSQPGVSSLSFMSDINGLAQSSFMLPATAGLNRVNVSVGGRQQAGVATFDLKALAGFDPQLFDIANFGVPALPGQLTYQDGTYTMTGATVVDNSGTSDRASFAWRDLTGDGYVLARVQFIQADSGLAQAGVMMRSSLDADSPNVAMLLTATSGVAFQFRDTVGANTGASRLAGISGPVWVLLRRHGDVFTAFYSVDGVTWNLRSTRTLALGSTLKVGFTHGTRTIVNNSASFDGVRMGSLATAPWEVADIGLPRAAAVDDFSVDSVLVRAGGTDMTGAADNFHYVYQPLVGDGRLVARVVSHLSFNSATKSALMVRESLDAGSRHVSLSFAAPSGVTLRKRELTNGTTTSANGVASVTAPYWLRVDRLGSRINTYASADGEAWTATGSVAFDPGATPLIGLAAASNNTGQHGQSLFDHIRLETAEGARGWNGAYYEGSDFKNSRAFRRDLDLDFSWPALQSPAPGVPVGAYSVRWQGDLVPAYSETYTFTTLSQGAVRVIINGQTVIDRLTPHSLDTTTGTIVLQAGESVRVVVEYANTIATDARIRLSWSSASQIEEPVPFVAVRSYDADDDGLPDAWEVAHGLNPNNSADAALDSDGDGLTNLQEYLLGGNPSVADNQLAGAAIVETWTGIGGSLVRDFTKDARSHNAPATKVAVTSLDFPLNVADNYARRVRGYIVAPASGDYRFYLSANDSAELWLSPSDDPFARVKIARLGQGASNHRQYDARAEQKSGLITLQAGQPYFFEVLHKEGGSVDHLTVAWTRPGFTSPEVISESHLATYAGSAADLDGNGLPDTWELAEGLTDSQLTAAARGSYGDADGDRLPNLLEYQRGLKPFNPDTDGDGYEDFLEVLVEVDPLATSDLQLAPWQLGDVGPVNVQALANRLGSDVFKLAGNGTGVALHKEDSFRFLYREITGDFDLSARIARPEAIPTGLAGVSIRSSLDSRAVSMTLLQALDGKNSPFIRTAAGKGVRALPSFTSAFASDAMSLSGYWFRIRRSGDLVSLFYSADGQNWILSNSRTLDLGESSLVGFAICHNMGPFTSQPDIDLPVRIIKDIRLVTDLTSPASAEAIPPEATATTVATLGGNTGVIISGQWTANAEGIVSKSVNGRLNYTFTLPADGLHRLILTTHSPSNRGSNTLFPIEVSVDGQLVKRLGVPMSVGEDGIAHVVTPWLKAGPHTVQLFYDNVTSYRPLRIRSLVVEALGGPDADDNGRVDWIDARLAALNTVEIVGSSYVSPASLTGRTLHRSFLTLDAGEAPVLVNPAPGYGWYADVPLSEAEPFEVFAHFENSGSVQGVLLGWSAINLLELPEGDFPERTISIRKGDGLRLTAYTAAATGGTATVSIVPVVGTTAVHTVSDPVGDAAVHAFTNPGIYTVTATYTDSSYNTTTAAAFTVNVLEAAFAYDPTTGLNNSSVIWDNPLAFDHVLFEIDQGLLLVRQEELPEGGARFALLSSNIADSFVLARLGENGPIFGHATVHSTRVATVADTGMDLIEAYPDGSQLIGVPLLINRLTEVTRVVVEIVVQGVTFEDGTTTQTLVKADFDANGHHYLKFVYPAGVDGSICHRVRAYEGDVYLGQF